MRESSEYASRQSGRTSRVRSPSGDLAIQSGELEDDDFSAALEPNDILDLPRVR